MNKTFATTSKYLLFTLLFVTFSYTNFALHPKLKLMICPSGSTVTNGTSEVCSGEGTGSLVAWQNSINIANPLDAAQDPDDLGSIVYSSVLPEAGSALPNDFLPTGITTQSDNCIIENQSTSAYLYCDTDASGSINAGDTYTLLSSYSLLVYPEIQVPIITDISCEITISGACPNDIITLANQSIPEGVITNNGTNEVTYTAADGDSQGTIDITIVSGISGSLCTYADNIPTPDCPIEGCPIPVIVADETDGVCASGGVAGLVAWQQSVEDENPLDGNTDAGGFGEIVFSDVEPVPGGQEPSDKLPTGIFDGPDFCSPETQEISAYLHCTQPGNESYTLLSTFTLIVYPPPMSVVVTMDGSDCGDPTVELHAANGDVCETLSGNCTTNGIPFDYDFSTTPTGMALADAPAGCVLPAAGSIACSDCVNITLTDDPCSCSDPLNFSSGPNYFFHEVIEISATAGQTWNLTGLTSGQLYDNTGAVLTYPLPLNDNMFGTFTISVWVLEGLAYEASFQEMDGTTISIGNSCTLPDDIDVTCPANVVLGTYDCTTLDDITDCPSTIAELMAAPYNMTIDLNSFCGTPVILCDDDEEIDICDGDLTVTRFITVFDDFNGDDQLDGIEPDVECEFTIELLGDEEEPDINEDDGELDITICSTDAEATCFEDLAEDFFDDIEDLFIEDAEGSITGIFLSDPETGMTWTINVPTATDNCGLAITEFDEINLDDDDNCFITYLITWTIIDECGENQSDYEQLITFMDCAPPNMEEEAEDETISCDNPDANQLLADWLDNNGGAEAEDNCSDVDWSNNYSGMLTDNSCTQTATVVFTATDDCDNESMTTATFTITDTEGPEITTAAMNQTISCDNANIEGELDDWLDNNGGAVAMDNCSYTWSNDYLFETDDGCSQTATVTFTATDGCGLSASTTAIFTVTDTEAPMIETVAMDETISCDNNDITGALNTWLISQGGAVATDNCNFGWTNNFTALVDDGCSQTATVTFTATDDCGLTANTTATFTVTDTEVPMIGTAAMDETISCDNTDITGALNTWLANQGGAVATDNCNFEWTNNFTALVDDGCSQTAMVTFTATDDCGLVASTTATFTVTDTEVPMIGTAAMDETISCDNTDITGALNTWLANQGGAVATDNCNFEWTNNFTALVDDGCSQTAMVTFTATDDCGLTASTTARFTVTDTEAPMIGTAAMDETISCDNTDITGAVNDWLANQGGAVATDNCNFEWTNNFTALVDDGCSQTAMVTFTATDDCGLVASTTATFTVTDTEAPMIETAAIDEAISCDNNNITGALNTWLTSQGGAVAMDNCNFEWTNDFTMLSTDACTQTATVTFTATDDCGLSVSTTATFSVFDNTGPIVGTPPDVAGLTCFENAGEPATTESAFLAIGGTISDNCSTEFTVINQQTTTGNFCPNGMPFSIMRTYYITDECGNTTVAPSPQMIQYLESTTGPMITAVANTCYKFCGDLTNPMESDITYMTDCALGATVAITGPEIIGQENCNGTIYRFTYTVTDDCGRTDSATRDFIIGNNSPTIETPPFNLILDCGDPDNSDYISTHLGLASVSASCGLDATISYSPTNFDDLNCGDSRVVTFLATDACGRTATATTTIVLQDPEPPMFTTIPPEFCNEIPCSADVNAWYDHWLNYMIEGLEASDNCTPNPTIERSNPNLNTICIDGEAITVVNFIASDDCGNSTTITGTFTILSVPPIFTFVPQDATIACGDTPVFGMATAMDECGNVVITFDDVEIGDNCTGMIVRTWTATNDCGLTATATTIITFTNSPTEDPTANISGVIATENQQGVAEVAVSLENSSGISLNYETGDDGAYVFSDLAVGHNYTVSPILDEDPLNGVSTYDLILIARHILQLEHLDSPYKIIAADINRSGTITTMDLVELKKLILFIDEAFSNNTSWRFVEADYVFPNPENPFATIFPEEVYLNGLLPAEVHDFVGVKIGDVNNSAQANGLLETEDRTEKGAMIMEVEDKLLLPGEEYEVVFKAESAMQLSAFQFSINFEPAQLDCVQCSKGDLKDLDQSNFGFSKLNVGGITTSWHSAQGLSVDEGSALFKMTFVAKEMVRLSEVLHVNSRFTKAEAHDAALNEMNVKLRFNSLSFPNNTFALYGNKPNPFKESTIISFHLPGSAEASIEIYDLSGRMVHRVRQACDAGYNEMEIFQSDLSSSGVYYYKLVTNGFESTKKMLLQRF